jgi:hypothetical protein
MTDWLVAARKRLANQGSEGASSTLKASESGTAITDETVPGQPTPVTSPQVRELVDEVSPANDSDVDRSSPRARRWRIMQPGRPATEVLFTPEVTAEDVREVYRGAIVKLIAEAPKRRATPAEAHELRALIAEVLRAASEAERVEALTIACADPDAAMLSFRALRDELRQNEKWLGQRYAHGKGGPHEAQ